MPITLEDKFPFSDDNIASPSTHQLVLMVQDAWTTLPPDPFENVMYDLMFDNDMIICQRHVAQVTLGGATEGCKPITIDMLTDGGSNINLTGDSSILEDVHTIPPVTLGLAADGECSPCTQQGWLPLLLHDGTIMRTKAFVNASATNIILSPEALLYSHPDLQR